MLPIYSSENPIVCNSVSERDALLSYSSYRIAGLSVSVLGVLYYLNADLQTWRSSAQETTTEVPWFPPSGDAGASLTALSAAEAAREGGPRTIVQQPGTYTYTTPAQPADGTDLLTHELATNVNAIATHTEPSDAIISRLDTYTVLTAVRTTEIVVGSIKFTVSPDATEIAVGDKLYFSDGEQRVYPVIVANIVDADVYVQDPFENAFTLAGGTSLKKSVGTPKNIKIRGRGLFTGSGGKRLIELAGATNCLLRDLRFDDSQGWSPGGFAVSFDNGGYRNIMDSLTLSRPNHDSVVQYGLGFESQFHSTMTNCEAYGLHSPICWNDCIGCSAVDCTAVGRPNAYSFVLQTGGATANVGCINSKIIRGTYGGGNSTSAPVNGINLAACTYALLDAVTFLAASDAQLSISSTITGTDIEVKNPRFMAGGNCAMLITGTGRLRVYGGTTDPFYYTSGVGISWGANMSGFIDGLRFLGTTVQTLKISAPISLTKCEIQGRIPITSDHSTGKLTVDQCILDTNAIASGIGVYNNAGATATVSLRDTKIILKDADANSTGVSIVGTTGVTTELHGIRTVNGSTGTGVKGKAGCPVLVGNGNNLASCGTQYDATAIAAATHVVTAAGVA